jgi:hypothetical protein
MVFTDGFITDWNLWKDLFDDWDRVALDKHGYLAWNQRHESIEEYCQAFEQ